MANADHGRPRLLRLGFWDKESSWRVNAAIHQKSGAPR